MRTIQDINWETLKCEEASMFSSSVKIDCGQPATHLIWHNKDRRAYRMCDMCADHNIKNRGGIKILEKTSLDIQLNDLNFEYGKECLKLRSFIYEFVIKYFIKDKNSPVKDVKDFINSEHFLKDLLLIITNNRYTICSEGK